MTATTSPSLQRGAKLFVNYCVGCHGAQHMRYNRLATDLGLNEKQVAENLIFRGTMTKDGYVTDKVGDTIRTAMDRADAKEAFGVIPPDLVGRGACAWNRVAVRVPARLLSRREVGNRMEQPGVSERRDAECAVGDRRPEQAHRSRIPDEGAGERRVRGYASRRQSRVRPRGRRRQGRRGQVRDALRRAGQAGNDECDRLRHRRRRHRQLPGLHGEPNKGERIQVGIKVLIFLSLLFSLAYWTKREYWKDVH
jgi:ubiquinol-cytochrome c reductase cytochrome c1 subunit